MLLRYRSRITGKVARLDVVDSGGSLVNSAKKAASLPCLGILVALVDNVPNSSRQPYGERLERSS